MLYFLTILCDVLYSQTAATGKEEGRDASDRAYNMVTKGFFSIRENRNSHRYKLSLCSVLSLQ